MAQPQIKDDIKEYTDALGDIPAEASYIDTETDKEGKGEAKLRHYTGILGDFDYDPSQFQLQMVDKKEDEFGPAGQMECLRYVGSETDGSKIEIPKGVTNANFMFAGTDVTSVPKIPEGVTTAFHMFGGCQKLTDGRFYPPSSLKETPFMFADCPAMTLASVEIPGTMKEVSYMYANCKSLGNMPRIANGVEVMNGTFANCPSLTKSPHIPKSVKQADDITFGCPNIDRVEKDASLKAREKAREKYAKKLEKPTFMGRMSSAFSAVMQMHALRKCGYGVIAAPLAVHVMRKQGVFSRDMGSGIASLAMTKQGPMGRMVYNAAQKRSQNLAVKREAKKQEKLEIWDRIYGDSSDFTKRTKSMAASGRKDFRNNLFTRVLGMTELEKNILRESHGYGELLKTQDATVNAMDEYGQLGVRGKKDLAKWYKERLAEKRAYAVEAKQLIMNDPAYTDGERHDALDGLNEMNAINTSELVSSIKTMQEEHSLFDIRDQKDIDAMMRDISGKPLFYINEKEQTSEMSKPTAGFSFSAKPDAPSADNEHAAEQPSSKYEQLSMDDVFEDMERVQGVEDVTEENEADLELN